MKKTLIRTISHYEHDENNNLIHSKASILNKNDITPLGFCEINMVIHNLGVNP